MGGPERRTSGRADPKPHDRPHETPPHHRMPDRTVQFASLAELRAYVHETLCARENLLPETSALSEYVLSRDGADCGRQFFVQGPRLVQLSAVWAADQGLLYLYDTRGERFLKLSVAGPASGAAA